MNSDIEILHMQWLDERIIEVNEEIKELEQQLEAVKRVLKLLETEKASMAQ